MNITTNNHHIPLLHWWDLTEKEQKEFDYITPDEREEISCRFFRYRGWTYDTAEFVVTPQGEPARQELNELSAWHGYQSDSFYSGIVIRYVDDYEAVQAGTYIS